MAGDERTRIPGTSRCGAAFRSRMEKNAGQETQLFGFLARYVVATNGETVAQYKEWKLERADLY